jgi:zinc transport system substrate-binding protein
VTTVFSERLVSPRVAETLANEAGVRTAVLDPLEGLAKGSDEDYLSLMRENVKTLGAAGKCG